MSFSDILDTINWEDVKDSIYAKTSVDVENALAKSKRDIEDFKALISPAAAPYLEQMARISRELTLKRFGKTIQLYIPLYLSNYCENDCVYCGFNSTNKINRTMLTEEQVLQEIEVIKSYGYEHILLVTGESNRADKDYIKRIIELIKDHFSLISIEVQPLEQDEYKELIDLGLNTTYVYQETYNKKRYSEYHTKGRKANFDYRLQTPDRLGKSGIRKVGLGFLIGLEDWRTEAFFTASHLVYLEKTYWATKYSISFPRLRPHVGNMQPNIIMEDKELVQLICAYRIFNEEVEISISTRESEKFRDNILLIGATSYSAGSSTEPGGYVNKTKSLEQFKTNDDRSPAEIADIIKEKGYEPIWKDWDKIIS